MRALTRDRLTDGQTEGKTNRKTDAVAILQQSVEIIRLIETSDHVGVCCFTSIHLKV
jgi:hypothetical protein